MRRLLNEMRLAEQDADPALFCRRMGRAATELWYEPVDMRVCRVLLVEWTHGNNPFLQGIDLRGVLVSTATETLEHRRAARCEDMRKLHQGDKK